MAATAGENEVRAGGRLSTLDKYLPVWIGAAMLTGIALGQWIPAVGKALNSVQIGGISLPIAAGPPIMMHPVLAKVRYRFLPGGAVRAAP